MKKTLLIAIVMVSTLSFGQGGGSSSGAMSGFKFESTEYQSVREARENIPQMEARREVLEAIPKGERTGEEVAELNEIRYMLCFLQVGK